MGDLQFTSYNPQSWTFTINVDEQLHCCDCRLMEHKSIEYGEGDS